MSVRSDAGRLAKAKGHEFEQEVVDFLSTSLKKTFILEGSNTTKVDARSSDNTLRYSIKKTPSGLQVGLITQQNFINALNITDPDIIRFINEFFGGNDYEKYNRHRKKIHEIDSTLSSKFLRFLHDSAENICKVAITHGSLNQSDDVNFIIFPKIKHDVRTLNAIDVHSFIKDVKENGVWQFRPTTIDLFVSGVKVMNIQMFGSGTKYSSGYHSLQFRITCGKIDEKHIRCINT
jgi:hypothetical protein